MPIPFASRPTALFLLAIIAAPVDLVAGQSLGPLAQDAYLKASNTFFSYRFGNSVAISGDRLVVGSLFESGTTSRTGAAYVFERSGGSWVEVAYLKAANDGTNDMFGSSVAISGDRIVVGAWMEDSSSVGVNGDALNNDALDSGAAYVFELVGGTWTQQAYLKASNTEAGDQFGADVAIDGDTIVVTAPREGSSASGLNGDQADNSASSSGAAYVFRLSSGSWSQEAYVKASNTEESDRFGLAVAVSGDRMLVGAPGEASAATGINGVQADNAAPSAGAAYLFERAGGAWSQVAYMKASNTDGMDRFGWSVGLSGDQAIVGAPIESSSSVGVGGNEADNSLFRSGAAYVFSRTNGLWSQEAYLKASNTGTLDEFGRSVSISGDRAIVSAPVEGSGTAGINGDATDDSSSRAGAAYTFTRVGGAWSAMSYMKASNAGALDEFGTDVAVDGRTSVVGAVQESSSAVGVDGDEGNNDYFDAGAAYVFYVPGPENFCRPAIPNSTGQPAEISASGSLTASNNSLTLHAEGLPLNQFGIFINSMGTGFVPMPGGRQGTLCLGGGSPVGRHNRSHEILATGTTGAVSLLLDLTDLPSPTGGAAAVAGDTWNFQFWYRDQNPSATANFSDGISIPFE